MFCLAADRFCGRLEHSHDNGQGAPGGEGVGWHALSRELVFAVCSSSAATAPASASSKKRVRARSACWAFSLAEARGRGARGAAPYTRPGLIDGHREPLGRVHLHLQANASHARMARTSSAAAGRSAHHAHRAVASARERTLSSPSQGIGKRSGAGPDETPGTLCLNYRTHSRNCSRLDE